ncbi:hypothetical protein [Microbaculum marinum]|uniref:SGNH hydrolase-type esterase domain-containing protein n=1 Tax=Microbaculum marinum TaxID=1764581 RepID=A0AAW9RQL9_9HYPH
MATVDISDPAYATLLGQKLGALPFTAAGGAIPRLGAEWLALTEAHAAAIAAVTELVEAGVKPLAGFSRRDLVPSLHLASLAGTGSRKIVYVGESQMSGTGSSTNGVDASQMFQPQLSDAIDEANPGRGFDHINRSIGGALWDSFLKTGTQILAAGTFALPSWFATAGNTWASYIEADEPDLLVIGLGLSNPVYSQIDDITAVLTEVSSWPKPSPVVFVTPAPPITSASAYEYFKGMIAYLRTLCRSNGNGFTAWPNIPHIGLIDVGRWFHALTRGKDLALQSYLEVYGPNSAGPTGIEMADDAPYLLPSPEDGDFMEELTFDDAGNGALYALGAREIVALIGGYVQGEGNYVRIELSDDGGWTPAAQSNTSSDRVTGTKVVPAAGDVVLRIACRNENVRVDINGETKLKTKKARYASSFEPYVKVVGTTFSSTPTMSVDLFYQGVARDVSAALPGVTEAQWYGEDAEDGPTGGNAFSHPSSVGVACIAGLIDMLDLTAPVIPRDIPTSDPGVAGQIWADSGVLTVSAGA